MTAPTMSAPILTPPAWSTRWTPLTHEPSPEEMAALFDQLTYADIAKTIDHSLLRPELDDAFIDDNLRLAAEFGVASATMRPADVERAVAALKGSDVLVGTVVGFPHGNHLTMTKVFETERALDQGAQEIDMVIQIGALKSGRDLDVEADIRAVVDVAHTAHA